MKVRKVALLQALGRQFDEYTKDQLTAFIVCRNVLVDGVLATDPRLLVNRILVLFTFTMPMYPGGYKLEHALDQFALDVQDLVMLDAGASTGVYRLPAQAGEPGLSIVWMSGATNLTGG